MRGVPTKKGGGQRGGAALRAAAAEPPAGPTAQNTPFGALRGTDRRRARGERALFAPRGGGTRRTNCTACLRLGGAGRGGRRAAAGGPPRAPARRTLPSGDWAGPVEGAQRVNGLYARPGGAVRAAPFHRLLRLGGAGRGGCRAAAGGPPRCWRGPAALFAP